MAYTCVRGAHAARLAGSSPALGTTKEIAAKPHRSKPQKNSEKNIGSNHILILGEENFLIINQ